MANHVQKPYVFIGNMMMTINLNVKEYGPDRSYVLREGVALLGHHFFAEVGLVAGVFCSAPMDQSEDAGGAFLPKKYGPRDHKKHMLFE